MLLQTVKSGTLIRLLQWLGNLTALQFNEDAVRGKDSFCILICSFLVRFGLDFLCVCLKPQGKFHNLHDNHDIAHWDLSLWSPDAN